MFRMRVWEDCGIVRHCGWETGPYNHRVLVGQWKPDAVNKLQWESDRAVALA